MNTPSAVTNTSAAPGRRRSFASLLALTGIGLLASGAARAQGFGGHRHHGDPEDMLKRLDYRIGYMIKEVGGTPEQKDKLVAIAKATMTDMKPLREQHMGARKQGLELLAAANIDKAALERLRVGQITLADSMSKRVLQGMVDAAEVLTPEQRTKLATHMKERMERRKRG